MTPQEHYAEGMRLLTLTPSNPDVAAAAAAKATAHFTAALVRMKLDES